MTPHPLTPRQPVLLANAANTAVTAFVTIALFMAMITILPPVAWIGHLDQTRDADVAFLVALVREYVDGALVRSDPLGSLSRLIGMPLALASAMSSFGIGLSIGLRASAALLAGVMIGAEVRRIVLAHAVARPRVTHVKGLRLLTGKAAKRSLATAWAKRFGGRDPGIELADGLAMPCALEAEHMLIVGGTGAGKTTILEKMMDGALERGDRLLALDIKGDVTARFPTEDFVLLGLGDPRSASWLLGLDIVSPEDAAELAAEMIPETSDPSWSGGARQVLTAIIELLQYEARRRGKVWSWRQLDRLLKKPIEELFAMLRERDPVAASLIDVEREETRRQAMSFYLVLTANAGQMAKAFAAMGNSSGAGVSIRRWVSGKGCRNLILRQSQRLPELSAAMCRIVLKIAADVAGSTAPDAGSEPAAVWLFLDELPQVGRSAAIPRLAAIGRSLGVRLVAAIQSPAQLKEIYGHDGSQHLLDNMTTKIVGRVAGGSTASEISGTWIGDRTVSWREDMSPGADGRIRFEQRTQDIPVVEPAFLADELGLSSASVAKRKIRALVCGHGDVGLLSWPVGRWRQRRPATGA
ncbi:MAG: hypothetical protein DCC69_14445 [Hyphomicrobiales bacterium]|nr:MAG: hypothetical protein DCC69_14445 [Hyphomicrobiales bacterium]